MPSQREMYPLPLTYFYPRITCFPPSYSIITNPAKEIQPVVCDTYLSVAQSCSSSCSSCVFQGVVMNAKSVWMCVCVCLPWCSLFASGLGMKGPQGLVREALADVSWPVGTQFSRIGLPSRASFGSTLMCLRSVSCLYLPSPFLPSLIIPVSLSACMSRCGFVHR